MIFQNSHNFHSFCKICNSRWALLATNQQISFGKYDNAQLWFWPQTCNIFNFPQVTSPNWTLSHGPSHTQIIWKLFLMSCKRAPLRSGCALLSSDLMLMLIMLFISKHHRHMVKWNGESCPNFWLSWTAWSRGLMSLLWQQPTDQTV